MAAERSGFDRFSQCPRAWTGAAPGGFMPSNVSADASFPAKPRLGDLAGRSASGRARGTELHVVHLPYIADFDQGHGREHAAAVAGLDRPLELSAPAADLARVPRRRLVLVEAEALHRRAEGVEIGLLLELRRGRA